MHRPKTLLTTGAALVAALALPAAASAKPQAGTVLKVDRAHHAVEIVTAKHVVRRYKAAGKLLKKLKPHTAVSYTARGKKVVKLRAKGRARKLSFYAKVVASGKHGAVLRLADGRRVKLGGAKKGTPGRKRVSAAGSVTLNIQGLKVGQVVLITQTADAAGNVTVTINLTQAPDANGGEDQSAAGTVTAVAADGSTLTIQTSDGRSLTFQTDSDMVDGFNVGDAVYVAYYQDTDGSLVADDVSSPGDSGNSGEDKSATGTVTGIAADGSTITVAVEGGGSMTFQTDSGMLDGISVGDVVDVAYYQDAGASVADDVSPVDNSSGD